MRVRVHTLGSLLTRVLFSGGNNRRHKLARIGSHTQMFAIHLVHVVLCKDLVLILTCRSVTMFLEGYSKEQEQIVLPLQIVVKQVRVTRLVLVVLWGFHVKLYR